MIDFAEMCWKIEEIVCDRAGVVLSRRTRVLFMDIIIREILNGDIVLERRHIMRNQYHGDFSHN